MDFRPLDGLRDRTLLRVAMATLVLLAVTPVAVNAITAAGDGDDSHPPAPPRDRPTVVADQSGHLVVYAPNGTVVYDDHRYHRYWDVDPVPGDPRTLFYVATAAAPPTACPGDECVRNVVGLLNLTTRERTRLYSRAVTTRGSSEWHDVDRVNDTHIAIADIKHDRVFIVDTATDRTTWGWNASDYFPPSSGGPPADWTHLNDVEVLDDGRVMASIRNQDQVVFIEPGEGVQESWTLGSEGAYRILHGQHNPDYIPAEQGGPAVLVADSQNNRVVEYQRRNGSWQRTWVWRDSQMQWTRDADRLPNGHTLITDTNGDRVLEVDEHGAVVWSIPAAKAYDAERLGTGDESTGGPSSARAELDSRVGLSESAGAVTAVTEWVSNITPPLIYNSLLYVLPLWMTPGDLLLVGVALFGLLGWASLELWWRRDAVKSALGRLRRRVGFPQP